MALAADVRHWLTAESSQCRQLTAELRAPHHFCSVLHFPLLMGVYFLTVHGRSLSVSDRYWIADSEAVDFTGSVRSNFGWIVRPLRARLVECFGGGWRLAVKRAIFDLFRSGKNELSHYASTAQRLKCGKTIHWNKSTTQKWLETTNIVSSMQL